jgi:hypothetical protein
MALGLWPGLLARPGSGANWRGHATVFSALDITADRSEGERTTTVEHRTELEDILLNGLPEQERRHVMKVIQKVNTEKLRRKQSETAADNQLIDLTDLDLGEDPA